MNIAAWTRVSSDAFNAALAGYLVAMVAYFFYLAFSRDFAWRSGRTIALVGLAAHVVSVVARAMAAKRVPWGNMYEYSSLLALLIVLVYLVWIETRFHERRLGGFVLMTSALTMAVAVSFLYVGPEPLVPALQSYWIKIHVVAAISGSSILALGSIVTILYLVKLSKEEGLQRAERRSIPPIMGAAVGVEEYIDRAQEPRPLGEKVEERSSKAILPSSAVLDRIAYGLFAFGFPIWTFAVIAGAIWAQEAWGRYWGWDPKETWSFITWVIYAGYLHARATSGWKGRRAAVVALVGFASLLITYYAVNLWIVGLHSYKGF